jgi:hypothetical protein
MERRWYCAIHDTEHIGPYQVDCSKERPPNMEQYVIELDVVDFESAEFQAFLLEERIIAILVKPADADGWPIYRYIGSKLALERLCTGPYDDGELTEGMRVAEMDYDNKIDSDSLHECWGRIFDILEEESEQLAELGFTKEQIESVIGQAVTSHYCRSMIIGPEEGPAT